MKWQKIFLASIIIPISIYSLSGCGITIATVAGVTAYSLSKSDSQSQSINSILQKNIESSNLVTAILDDNIILAGQVSRESDIKQTKIQIIKQNDELTIYSYIKVAPLETADEKLADTKINQQVNKLLKEENHLKTAATVSNKIVYLLADKNISSGDINRLGKNILTIPGVNSITIIRPEK